MNIVTIKARIMMTEGVKNGAVFSMATGQLLKNTVGPRRHKTNTRFKG